MVEEQRYLRILYYYTITIDEIVDYSMVEDIWIYYRFGVDNRKVVKTTLEVFGYFVKGKSIKGDMDMVSSEYS